MKFYYKTKIFYLLISMAIVIVGLFETPTPSVITPPILASSLFLILSILMIGTSTFKQRHDYCTFAFLLFFVFFLTVPNFVAFYRGNLANNIIRDILPMLFIFLFILWLPIIKLDTSRFLNLIVKLLTFLGLAFSFKYLSIQDLSPNRFSYFSTTMDYYSSDPSVLFSAIYFSIEALRLFYNNQKLNSLIFTFLGLVCFASFVLTGHRLQSFLYIFFYFFTLIIFFWYKPQRFFFYFIILLSILIPIYEYLINIFLLLYKKNLLVGFNNRFEEFLILKEDFNFLIGNGWGALFSTFANSFSPTRFVHNFFLFFFYKIGLIGLLFSFLLFFFSFRVLFISLINILLNFKLNCSNKDYPILIATLSSLIYCFFFSATFKSLSFGLLIVLVNCYYFLQKYNKNYLTNNLY